MKILAIDSSSESGSIAITENEIVLFESVWHPKSGHTAELTSQLHEACLETKISLSEIEAFAVTIGPGSFTGVRVALSFLKGIVLLSEKPVVPVSTLSVLAASVREDGLICPMLDARRDEIFSAVYRHASAVYLNLLEQKGESPEVFFDRLKEQFLNSDEPILFLGSGARKYSSFIDAFPKQKKTILPISFDTIKASVLAQLAFRQIQKGEFLKGAENLVPEYLRASEAELRLKKVES